MIIKKNEKEEVYFNIIDSEWYPSNLKINDKEVINIIEIGDTDTNKSINILNSCRKLGKYEYLKGLKSGFMPPLQKKEG